MRLGFLQLLLFLIETSIAEHPLHKKLHTWHTLKLRDMRHSRIKRSIMDDEIPTLDQLISFNAFNKTFRLSLLPSPEVFAMGFKAFVSGKNAEEEIRVDKAKVLKGTVLGDSKSHVIAHLQDGRLTASIDTDNETYIVEPMWRHMHAHDINEDTKSDMLVYRRSDVKLQSLNDPHGEDGFCDTHRLMREFRNKSKLKHDHNRNGIEDELETVRHQARHHRAKRSTAIPKICKITLVADHRFYREMGNSSIHETMYYLINLIERVNHIYKNTDWVTDPSQPKGVYKGYGFQIDNITIHNESTADPRYNQAHYWSEAKQLLEAFSEKKRSNCLSHLFTYVDFARGLLGLAYVGSGKKDDVGGICTKPYNRGNGDPTLYLNTGLTTTVNWGQRILTTEADLVTAHELGHNFGAEHDEEGAVNSADNCRPGQANGGNYIMCPAAVTGEYPNNKVFSVCSKRNILRSLKNKAPLCFQEEKNSFCGNFQVETHDNETCDVGYITGFSNEDRCCLFNCTLKPGAKCSNKNYKCCTEDCQIAGPTKMCRAHIPGLCLKDVYCNGVDKVCPRPKPMPDNTMCGDLGRCRNGVCEPFCRTKGLQPCLCSLLEDQFCSRCCAPLGVTGDELTNLCTPYLNISESHWTLPDNSRCTLGYCRKGKCHKQTQDVIERVWDIFKHISPDKIGQLLADNIVGGVLVFSLLFWVPCSCLINFVDKKRIKNRREEDKWRTQRGNEYTRNSMVFKGVSGSSAPVTPRIRIQRNNVAWNSGQVVKAGFGAKEQWKMSQAKGFNVRKSCENLDDLADAGGTPNSDDEDCAFAQLSVHRDSIRPPFVRSAAVSHPSFSPLTPPLGEASFDSEVLPIAASSNTNLPAAVLEEEEAEETISMFRLRSLHRQEATDIAMNINNLDLKDTTV
uniref:ADAM 17-like protease isoform X2 n=1 Tax=Ciona intestinalis TaxID=7719 RepID=UPI00089DD578|nr:ADAM 17-like protease isoform X2 [Ciona intestinalis]|eukprot:XP_018673044.1 ADAM 17-like protease isoform X2 [Ciona intestinalis]